MKNNMTSHDAPKWHCEVYSSITKQWTEIPGSTGTFEKAKAVLEKLHGCGYTTRLHCDGIVVEKV